MNATVIYSDRKTVGIQIKRDGSVVVHAPKGMSRARINELLEERAEWIRKHSQERAPRDGRIQRVYYLGKAYPVERGEGKTVFDGGRFILTDYFAESEELEKEYFENLETLMREQGLDRDSSYHYDTPLTVEHETEVLREAGFRDVWILEVWGTTCTVLAGK